MYTTILVSFFIDASTTEVQSTADITTTSADIFLPIQLKFIKNDYSRSAKGGKQLNDDINVIPGNFLAASCVSDVECSLPNMTEKVCKHSCADSITRTAVGACQGDNNTHQGIVLSRLEILENIVPV